MADSINDISHWLNIFIVEKETPASRASLEAADIRKCQQAIEEIKPPSAKAVDCKATESRAQAKASSYQTKSQLTELLK